MNTSRHLLLLVAGFAWLLCCGHIVAAYYRSPGASAFRSDVQNRFSAQGQRHRKVALFWGVIALGGALAWWASG